MAVVVELDFTGATMEQYDQVLEKMGFKPGGTGGPGLIFHLARKTDDGFHVTDVWESAGQFQEFAQTTIGPLTQEVGLTTQPTVTIHEIYNYLTQGS
ncbi:hypothetical protein ACWF9G_25510 [Nocardia sp. NPDC055029]|uniref:hypothetical protein n=1 Tax=Nocardia sp. NPDC060259 TaxID=3347088 RepID=UPI00365321BE